MSDTKDLLQQILKLAEDVIKGLKEEKSVEAELAALDALYVELGEGDE